MKRRMLTILIAVLLVIALILSGKLLYRHFVTDRITDWGGMENPYAVETADDATPSGDQETELSK